MYVSLYVCVFVRQCVCVALRVCALACYMHVTYFCELLINNKCAPHNGVKAEKKRENNKKKEKP